jgi:hypothetical protein
LIRRWHIAPLAKVDIVNDDDDGYVVVTHRGKTWWVDGERVR